MNFEAKTNKQKKTIQRKTNEHKSQTNIKVLESIKRQRTTNNILEFVLCCPSYAGQEDCPSDSLNTP